MSTFFTELAVLLADRQEMRLTIKKIGADFSIIAVPHFKEEGKHIYINGSPDELDQNFIAEISKPLKADTSFSSNADKVADEVKEDAEDDAKAESKKKASSAKKQAAKPALDKKFAPAKKAAPTKKASAKPAKSLSEQITGKKKGLGALLDKEAELNAAPDPDETVLAETEPSAALPEPAKSETEPVQTETNSSETVTASPEDENKKLFDHFMADGLRLFGERKYDDAVLSLISATELDPGDQAAQKELKKAIQWQKAVAATLVKH